MAVNNNTNLIKQICTASGLTGKELEDLKTRLAKMSDAELQAELTKLLSGNPLYGDMGLKVEKTVQQKISKEQESQLKSALTARLNAVGTNVKKAEDSNGFLGKAWSWTKNTFNFGDSSNKVREQQKADLKALESGNIAEAFKKITGLDYTVENVNKFLNNEVQTKSETALNGYTEGQDMASDITADIISGIAAVGIYTAAVAAAPFTGGASIAVGLVAAGVSAAAIKTGIKYTDAKSGGREYTADNLKKDLATGAFSGALAPITGGLGGAAGKTAAKALGIQAVKQVGKGIAEEAVEQTTKSVIKSALTNPTGYKYMGGNLAQRVIAEAAEIVSDGAVGGAIDNAFRTAYDGGGVNEVIQAGWDGFKYGVAGSFVIGGGMKLSGKAAQKFVNWLPFGEIPTDVPQVVIPKKTNTDLYPSSDITSLNTMKQNLQNRATGVEELELSELTAKPYKKEVEVDKTKGNFCFDAEGKNVAIGEKYTVIETQNDGTYTIYKATQSGSNPGFWVEHVGSGDLFYFKTGNGQQNITEHVSSQLYRAAGIDTPEMNLVAGPGFDNTISVENCWIKSKAIAELQPIHTNTKAAYEGFAVDAWLANWDAVCSGNTLIKNGTAVRVDFGGTLNFRARGANKKFGNEVPELSTLLDPNINPESASVFRDMTKDDLIKSLERVQSVTNDDIQQIYQTVKTYMNPEIFTTIQNRKTYLSYILNEAKKMEIKPNETIASYIKRVEEVVAYKYELPIKKMNLESEKRIRVQKDMIQQRNNVCTNEDQLAIWDYKGFGCTANTCINQGNYSDPLVTKLDAALDKTQLTEDVTLYRGDHFILDSHVNLRYRQDFSEYDACSFNRGYYDEDGNFAYSSKAPLTAVKYVDGKREITPVSSMDDIVGRIFKKGKIVEETQFVSTTLNPNVAKEFGMGETDIIYKFKAPKGLKATCPEKLDPVNYGRKTSAGGNLTGRLEGSETEILLKRGFKYRMDNLIKEDGKFIIECTILSN